MVLINLMKNNKMLVELKKIFYYLDIWWICCIVNNNCFLYLFVYIDLNYFLGYYNVFLNSDLGLMFYGLKNNRNLKYFVWNIKRIVNIWKL